MTGWYPVKETYASSTVRPTFSGRPSIQGRGERSARRKPGEYLWDDPHGYDYGAFLRARQRETSPTMWFAFYQQRPAPEDGGVLQSRLVKAL